jgi:hypothetical protein
MRMARKVKGNNIGSDRLENVLKTNNKVKQHMIEE